MAEKETLRLTDLKLVAKGTSFEASRKARRLQRVALKRPHNGEADR